MEGFWEVTYAQLKCIASSPDTADIVKWTRSCQICATRNVGRPVHPPQTPIPVAGPFDRVGVDIIRFHRVNRLTSMQLFSSTTLLSGLRYFQPKTNQF